MKSIRSKILLIVCLLVAISVTVVGGTVAAMMYKSSLDTLENTMSESANIAADLVVEYLETYRAVATETGLLPSLSDPETPLATKQALLSAKATQYGFLGGSIADLQGNNLFSDSNVADRDYFTSALKGETTVSDILFSRSANAYTINVAAPLWAKGVANSQIVGVVFYNIDANALSNITNQIQVGETGSAYMLDKDNFTIAHKSIKVEDRDNTKEALPDNPDLQPLADIEGKMTQGESGFGLYSYGGVKKLMAYAPVSNGLGWSLAVTAEVSEFIQSTYTAIFATVVLVLVAIAVGLVASVFLANSIAKPIKEVEQAALALAEGKLDTPIRFTGKDELGRLAESMRSSMSTLHSYIGDIDMAMHEMSIGNFNLPPMSQRFVGEFTSIETSIQQLSEQMSTTLAQITISSDQVSSGSEQVSSGAQILSQGATEQASAVEQLSASINEISQQVRINAEHTQTARTYTDRAASEVNVSNQHMQEMISAMDDISRKSSEIGKIIKSIEDIAFQTNILALNAAVEAARAGAAGKGFAVVADEVRNLAGKSAESAKNTTVLIEETVQAVQNGTRIAASTADALGAVVESAGQIADFIGKIAVASEEQSNSIAQVTTGVDQISSVVQTNSATAEESAAASEELSAQAQMLKALVSSFRLKDSSAQYREEN